MPNGWRTIKSLVHKIRLHGRRGKGMAESFSREKSRHAPQKESGWEILCDLPPVWPRLVRPTNLMPRMNGKKTLHTHRELIYKQHRMLGTTWYLPFITWIYMEVLNMYVRRVSEAILVHLFYIKLWTHLNLLRNHPVRGGNCEKVY